MNHRNLCSLLLGAVLLVMAGMPSHAAELQTDTEYYIWLNIYEKLLGSNADGSGPALSAFGTNSDADSYKFVAEASGQSGYVLLRQKSTGCYLAASTSNTWSVLLETTRSTDDRFCWALEEGTYVYLKNKKSGDYLGVDGANKGSTYVSVYYDKPYGSHAQFSVIPAVGDTWNDARLAYVSGPYTNAWGVDEVDYCLLAGQTIDRSDAVDIHVTANSTPLSGTTTVNLGSDRTWLIIDNIVPSTVISTYLKYVTIGGQKAVNGTNCRVAIWLNGAAVIPLPSSAMLCRGEGVEFTLTSGNHSTLGQYNNAMTSFTLRRGYMATVGTDTGLGGYTRVFVADHADLEVTLPTALAGRISSVWVKPWQYLSKKGWASTGGAGKGTTLRASWFWSWSAGYSSTTDMEYVPCRQHLYWPSASEVNRKTASAAFSINEPEHSEQHTSSQCSCGGTISSWKCYQLTSDFKAGGGRIGSPQPTDFSFLTEYCNYVDNMSNRCDFTVTHAYWDISSRSEASYADWFVSQCKTVWNNTGCPLWLSELEIGSSWGESWSGYSDKYGTYRKYLQVLLQRMDECGWIERYCIYGFDNYWSYMFYDDGSITPAGQVYRDHRSTFAYNAAYTKVPTWWAPSVKTPVLALRQSLTDDTFTFTVVNANADMTGRLYVERQTDGGTWNVIAEATDRSAFDSDTIVLAGVGIDNPDLDTDLFRATVVTLTGDTVHSTAIDGGYLVNPRIVTDTQTSVSGWTCSRDAANGYTKSTGDTYFEVWDATAANINFDYYQDLTELPAGIYALRANVFNSTNGVDGAAVNGAVGLYAQTSNQFYFRPVTLDDTLNAARFTTIDTIIVDDGNLRVGIRNLGAMTARWAGADNFRLVRVCDLDDLDTEAALADNEAALCALMPSVGTALDASAFIVNPDANRQTSYGWTTANVSVKTDAEAYDSLATNTYFNYWQGSAYTSSLAQTVAGLPAGQYVLGAMLRGSSVATLTLSAQTAADGQSAVFTGHGLSTDATSAYHQGWEHVTTPSFAVYRGDTLQLRLDAVLPSSGWWSADHFTLTRVGAPVETAVSRIRDDDDAGERQWEAGEQLPVFDLMGRAMPAHTPLPHGIYVRGGKKFVK